MQRIPAALALVALVLGSVALPCLAAGRAMAAEHPGSMEPCGSGAEADATMLCAVPGTTAPLSMAPETLPDFPVVVPDSSAPALLPAVHAGSSARLARDHSPPTKVPAFLLHDTLLI